MASHIPCCTGSQAANLISEFFPDSKYAHIYLFAPDAASKKLPSRIKPWVDAGIAGLHDLEGQLITHAKNVAKAKRDGKPDVKNEWLNLMKTFSHYDQIADPSFQSKPNTKTVSDFTDSVLYSCMATDPAAITIPILPFVNNADRNKINRAIAKAAGQWKSSSEYSGRLILPVIITHHDQIKNKTIRNTKVDLAHRCYEESQADGYWVVQLGLNDESGAINLKNVKFPDIIALHDELNQKITSTLRIAGPYWGLNLLLWARGLVDCPLIGVGSGYEYRLPTGSRPNPPNPKVAIPSLKRRVDVNLELLTWIENVLSKISPSQALHSELVHIQKNFKSLKEERFSRVQVLNFYKNWYETIAAVPEAGRSVALFQDLAAGYALAKSLPLLPYTDLKRWPHSVVEPLMLNCL